MALKTKCILADISPDDGLRISVMRTYDQQKHPEYKDVDQAWPELGPSYELIDQYFNKGLSWEQYVDRYRQQVLVGQAEKVKRLAALAKEKNVTILCLEECPEFCHRRLLSEECKKYQPDLKVILG